MIVSEVKHQIKGYLSIYENSQRVALSRRYPRLQKPIILVRRLIRRASNFFNPRLHLSKRDIFFDYIVARHQSLLRRALGNSDPRLQEQKIVNLQQAVKSLNGLVINPGQIFSLWQLLGQPNYKKGYVDGMLLSGGKVVEGVGGGLCQLSNFLFWIFLHAPFEVVERQHHSFDVFPDSGRVLPFGSGATVFYNFIDLQVKNISRHPLQLKIWLTQAHLKGQILSPQILPEKYHVFEKNHCFVKKSNKYFRYNEIWRDVKISGQVQNQEKIATNFAPVLYQVTEKYLKENNFEVLRLEKL